MIQVGGSEQQCWLSLKLRLKEAQDANVNVGTLGSSTKPQDGVLEGTATAIIANLSHIIVGVTTLLVSLKLREFRRYEAIAFAKITGILQILASS